jgi:hypothetical protein
MVQRLEGSVMTAAPRRAQPALLAVAVILGTVAALGCKRTTPAAARDGVAQPPSAQVLHEDEPAGSSCSGSVDFAALEKCPSARPPGDPVTKGSLEVLRSPSAYYRGPVPFTKTQYKVTAGPPWEPSTPVVAEEWQGRTTLYWHDDPVALFGGLASGACVFHGDDLLATARLDRVNRGKDVEVLETHYAGGSVVFRARSRFPLSPMSGKTEEETLCGRKRVELFIDWPTVAH